MDLDETSVIYGLELSARCMSSQPSETNITRFFIATQSLRQENQLHLVEFDDEHNVIDKIVYSHSVGEVWDLSASYSNPNIISTCYCPTDGKVDTQCRIWKVPMMPSELSRDVLNGSSTPHQSMEVVCDVNTEEYGKAISSHWKPIEDSNDFAILAGNYLVIYDTTESRAMVTEAFRLPDRKGHPCPVTSGRWNPHHNGKHFSIASEQNVIGWDTRGKSAAYLIETAHFQGVRDIDFNPNKMYDIVTCGDDCAIKFWDIRNTDEPIKVLADEHSHWVWSIRYNPFHDQLLLSGASDSTLLLHNQSSISSDPSGRAEFSDSGSESENSYEEKSQIDDGVLAKYEEHEDSVYSVEWSAADPWTFASLSYDGRLVINKVPKKVKFDILL